MVSRTAAACTREQALALARCDREIAEAITTLLSGYPDIDGCLLWLYDWRCEKRLLEFEIAQEDNASGD